LNQTFVLFHGFKGEGKSEYTRHKHDTECLKVIGYCLYTGFTSPIFGEGFSSPPTEQGALALYGSLQAQAYTAYSVNSLR
jgi:hypothetical protein